MMIFIRCRWRFLLLTILSGTILSGICLSTYSYGQAGADPAVSEMALQPAPIPGGVGSSFAISLAIGNAGTASISGSNFANQMRFTLTLAQCAPAPAGLGALSGELLTYFDITYDSQTRTYLGRQKAGIAIDAGKLYALTVNTQVSRASSSTAIDDIGAACNVQPNGSANPQPTANDFTALYTHTMTSPMPVSLLFFDAQAQPDHTVLLRWQTAWEQSNQSFIVERSLDLTTFETIGQVTDVAGTTTQSSSYRFIDQTPYRGTSYYRLRQLDQDGSSRVYPAKAVVLEASYDVYPNPISTRGFTLTLDEPVMGEITLRTMWGRPLEVNRSVTGDHSVYLQPILPMPAGVYILTVNERGGSRTYRLIAP